MAKPTSSTATQISRMWCGSGVAETDSSSIVPSGLKNNDEMTQLLVKPVMA